MFGKKVLATFVGFVMATSLFAGCGTSSGSKETAKSGDSGDTIKIGTLQPLSGDAAALGIPSKEGFLLAVKEINANGGLLGKKLQGIVEDDEGTPEKTVNAFKKLATQDKIIGLVGALKSKCSLAITNEAQQRKIVMISHASTNEKVTDAGDYIYRACFIDPFQGEVNANFALTKLNGKKAAVIYDNTNDYSKGLKSSFVEKFKAKGGEIVAEESYGKDDKDFNAQLTKIKGLKPDVLFIPDYYTKVALIAKQVKSQGITTTMLGGDGWESIASNAGDEVLGSYYSNHYTNSANDKEVKEFVEKYKKEYNTEPTAMSAQAYDSTYILAEAIQRAGSTEPEKIKAEMMKTDKKFVTGKIKFNEKRNPIKSAVMIKVDKVDGKIAEVYADTVNP